MFLSSSHHTTRSSLLLLSLLFGFVIGTSTILAQYQEPYPSDTYGTPYGDTYGDTYGEPYHEPYPSEPPPDGSYPPPDGSYPPPDGTSPYPYPPPGGTYPSPGSEPPPSPGSYPYPLPPGVTPHPIPPDSSACEGPPCPCSAGLVCVGVFVCPPCADPEGILCPMAPCMEVDMCLPPDLAETCSRGVAPPPPGGDEGGRPPRGTHLCQSDAECGRGEICSTRRGDCWPNDECRRGGSCDNACYGVCLASEGGRTDCVAVVELCARELGIVEEEGGMGLREKSARHMEECIRREAPECLYSAEGQPGPFPFPEEWEEGHERPMECPPPIFHACESRCAVTEVPGCIEKCLMQKEEEGMCGRFMGPPQGRQGEEQGCRPFTREDAKRKLWEEGEEVTPANVERQYQKMTEWWIGEVEREHGVQLTPEEAEHFPLCPRGGPEGYGPPGPGMPPYGFKPQFQRMEWGGPGMMGPPGPPHESVGEIFGRAVGMLLELSQDPNLPADVKPKVLEAIQWFSDAMGRAAAGEDVGQFIGKAKEILHELMGQVGFMGGGGPPPEQAAMAIEGMLRMVDVMLGEKIPLALSLMEELGYPVEGGEEILADLEEKADEVRERCAEILESLDRGSFERLRECFEGFRELFEEDMHRLEEAATRGVPEEVLEEVESRVGFEDVMMEHMPPMMGPPGMGPMGPGMGPSGMGPGGMMPPGMVPEDMRAMMEAKSRCMELEYPERRDCMRQLREEFMGGEFHPAGFEGEMGPPGGPPGYPSMMAPGMRPGGMGPGMMGPGMMEPPGGDFELMERMVRNCMEAGKSKEECMKELMQSEGQYFFEEGGPHEPGFYEGGFPPYGEGEYEGEYPFPSYGPYEGEVR